MREANRRRLRKLATETRPFLQGYILSPRGAKPLYEQGKQLYSAFMQRSSTRSRKLNVKALPKVALAIGKVTRLYYVSDRGGRAVEYRHDFATGSRPLLASSHDGKQLMLLGGAYRFTHRGIVDKPR